MATLQAGRTMPANNFDANLLHTLDALLT